MVHQSLPANEGGAKLRLHVRDYLLELVLSLLGIAPDKVGVDVFLSSLSHLECIDCPVLIAGQSLTHSFILLGPDIVVV